MRIETTSIKSHVLQGAIIMHAVVAVAIPAVAAVSIIFMGRRHRHIQEPSIGEEMMSNPDSLRTYIIAFSIVGIIVAFAFIYFKNRGRKFIVAVEFDDVKKTLTLFHKSYYNNKVKTIEIPYSNLSYQRRIGDTDSKLPNFSPVRGVNSNDLIVDDKISFFSNKQYAAEITMGGTYWNKEGGKIKMILNKIQEIQLQKS